MSPAHRFGFEWWCRRWPVAAAMAALALTGCARGDSGSDKSRAERLTAQDGSTGVALCDSYLDNYESCVIPGLPPAQVQRHHSGIVRQRQAWAELANTAAKQESLSRICRSAIQTARREFPSCEFSGG
jgi:hypothetical protein